MRLIKRSPSGVQICRLPQGRFYRCSALWEIQEIPGVFLYSTPTGWRLETAERRPIPRKLRMMCLKAKDPGLPFGHAFQTRRELLEALELLLESEQQPSQLPDLLSEAER